MKHVLEPLNRGDWSSKQDLDIHSQLFFKCLHAPQTNLNYDFDHRERLLTEQKGRIDLLGYRHAAQCDRLA
jgi:hypothetical protein